MVCVTLAVGHTLDDEAPGDVSFFEFPERESERGSFVVRMLLQQQQQQLSFRKTLVRCIDSGLCVYA